MIYRMTGDGTAKSDNRKAERSAKAKKTVEDLRVKSKRCEVELDKALKKQAIRHDKEKGAATYKAVEEIHLNELDEIMTALRQQNLPELLKVVTKPDSIAGLHFWHDYCELFKNRYSQTYFKANLAPLGRYSVINLIKEFPLTQQELYSLEDAAMDVLWVRLKASMSKHGVPNEEIASLDRIRGLTLAHRKPRTVNYPTQFSPFAERFEAGLVEYQPFPGSLEFDLKIHLPFGETFLRSVWIPCSMREFEEYTNRVCCGDLKYGESLLASRSGGFRLEERYIPKPGDYSSHRRRPYVDSLGPRQDLLQLF